MRVISGCQNGVDQAGLYAAERCSIPTGGWLPKGCKTLDGPRYDLRDRFTLKEHSSANYALRTADNVAEADFTLRIAERFTSAGEKCTYNAILAHVKDHFDIQLTRKDGLLGTVTTPDGVADILHRANVEILNVAGNAEQTSPGIQLFAFRFLVQVFTKWKELKNV